MPEQKYKQKGGEHSIQLEKAFYLEIEKIKDIEYTEVPAINKKQAWAQITENVEEKTDEDGKKTSINIAPNDIPIKKYGFTYQDNNITAHNFELLFEDRNKLYGVDGDNGIGRGNLMTKHNEFKDKSKKEIELGIESYIKHVVNIYNHYVPLRTQIFPEYAKHIPSMKYKINNETEKGKTEEGKTDGETKSEKNQKRKDTENVLKTIMTMFSEVSTDGKPKTVIEQLYDFIKQGDDAILKRYGTTLEQISEINGKKDTDDLEEHLQKADVDNLFKILTVFAWEKSGEIMDEYTTPNAKSSGGGPNGLTKTNGESRFTLSPAQRAYRRRAVFLCFLSFVWNSWLLFSTLFSLYSFMTRILDLRQDYIDRGIGDFGETESGNIFFSWFSVMQEIFTIGIVEMSTNIAQRSVTMAQSLANNTIDSLRYQGHLSWERGFAIYVNDLMSGVLTWSAGVSGEMNFQRSVNELMFEIRQTGLDLRTHAYSINNAITNSIGGMSATTMVLLRVLYPEEVPEMSSGAAVTLNLISNWVPVVGPVVSSIGNGVYVGSTLINIYRRHNIGPIEIVGDSLSALLEQIANTPGDLSLVYDGVFRRRPVLAIEDAPIGADGTGADTVADTDTVYDPANTGDNVNTENNHEGGSRGKKRSYKKGRKGKQVKKNRSYRRK